MNLEQFLDNYCEKNQFYFAVLCFDFCEYFRE